jgi:cytochrome c-type biogenesis protein CcmH/NrfG
LTAQKKEILMKKNNTGKGKLVKFESAMLATFIALVIGFLGGIVFSAFKMDSTTMGTSVMVDAEQTHTHDEMTAEMADEIEALEKAAAQTPENPDGWIALGNAAFDYDLHPKAIEAYEKALEIQPENANVWTDLGVMYRRNEEPEKAVSAFEKAQGVSPGHEVSLFNKGIVMMHDLNDMDGALKAWEELLEINPAAMTPGGMPIKDLVDKMKEQM